MKRPLPVLSLSSLFLLSSLFCALPAVVDARATSPSFSAQPTPDKGIPMETEMVLHKLKQSCLTNCAENKHQVRIEKAKGNMNELMCKDFCRFIFYTFKTNQDELFNLAKSNKLDAIVNIYICP